MEHRISVVTSDDQERMIATLTAAFLRDPFMRWMLPDPQRYLESFPPMMRALGRAACEHDTAFATADFSGVAVWMPPGASADEEGSAELLDRWVEPDKQGELAEASAKTAACKPDDDVTWHLPLIGVDPFLQGLLRRSGRRRDARRMIEPVSGTESEGTHEVTGWCGDCRCFAWGTGVFGAGPCARSRGRDAH